MNARKIELLKIASKIVNVLWVFCFDYILLNVSVYLHLNKLELFYLKTNLMMNARKIVLLKIANKIVNVLWGFCFDYILLNVSVYLHLNKLELFYLKTNLNSFERSTNLVRN